jgi:hypothetical protein
MINYAMFQRNGKAGYVLKPIGLRSAEKSQLMKVRKYQLRLTVRLHSCVQEDLNNGSLRSSQDNNSHPLISPLTPPKTRKIKKQLLRKE